MLTKQVISSHILSLIAECGCVSRRTFDLLPYSYRNLSANLKNLVDGGYIRLHDKGKDKRYTLLLPGKNALSQHNPYRYPPDFYYDNNTIIRRPGRSANKGDVAAIMTLAGYSVHTDDKPPLPAFTPPLSGLDESEWLCLYCNRIAYSYGLDVPDDRLFFKRESPINCYYNSLEVKGLFDDGYNKSLRFSRACGILLTPDQVFRVYHSRDVAMEFKPLGENKLAENIPQIFKGYLPGQQRKSILVFGNDGFTAAEKILDQNLDPQKRKMADLQKGKKVLLSVNNVGDPLFYLPAIKESLPLLSAMQYPFWIDELASYAVKTEFGLTGSLRMGTGLFCYEYAGFKIFSGLGLDLTNFYRLIKALTERPDLSVCMAFFDWQAAFYSDMLHKYLGRGAERLKCVILTDQHMVHIRQQLYEFWEEGKIGT